MRISRAHFLRAAIFLLSGIILTGPAWAQEDAGAISTGTPTEGLETPDQQLFVDTGEGLEAAVSGAEYRLGPGDVLAVSVWGPQPLTYRLGVTLEGKLLIPSVGEIDVNNLLLSDAKKAVRDEILSVYRNVDISVTLVQLRRFQVHVLGQVRAPGTYLATAVHRVSYAVAQARGFADNASQRRIYVEQGDSVRAEADLYAFLRRGITDRNPFLRDGDKIYVPFIQDKVFVRGELNDPGDIEFISGDRLSDMLTLAGGFTERAFLDTLEISRYQERESDPIRFLVINGGGLTLEHEGEPGPLPETMGTFSPSIAGVPPGKLPVYTDFLLQSSDRIFVRSVPEFRHRRQVEIQGEVRYPGAYSFVEGKTRISDLVDWAGGLTADANLAEARLVRRDLIATQDPEFERLKRMQVADMDEDEYAYFKVKSREIPGQMVVDFRKALRDQDPVENLLLTGGDLVIIPTRKDFVSVLGMVGYAGNVSYKPGLTARDYVQLAGGYTEDADRGKARVIRAENGTWAHFGEAGSLERGDVVFVPEKRKGHFWRSFREALTVSTQILTIYLVVDRALQ